MPDILEREPGFDFAQFRDWCELSQIRAGEVEYEFMLWLYSDANGER